MERPERSSDALAAVRSKRLKFGDPSRQATSLARSRLPVETLYRHHPAAHLHSASWSRGCPLQLVHDSTYIDTSSTPTKRSHPEHYDINTFSSSSFALVNPLSRIPTKTSGLSLCMSCVAPIFWANLTCGYFAFSNSAFEAGYMDRMAGSAARMIISDSPATEEVGRRSWLNSPLATLCGKAPVSLSQGPPRIAAPNFAHPRRLAMTAFHFLSTASHPLPMHGR